METDYSITKYFGRNLAELLSEKIIPVYAPFDAESFITEVGKAVEGKTYTQRVSVIAALLHKHLPKNFEEALNILTSILGEENPNETGMFKNFYWIMPIGKFIADFGLDHFEASMKGIEEVTKRNTGEYAIRPFIVRYPEKTLSVIETWAKSPNFHLRRLACEGLRPKLPWATKLEVFIDNPKPVFEILETLKEDNVMFVKKSVANHLTDWIKVNPNAVAPIISEWRKSSNPDTQWIIKRATRKWIE